MTTNIFTGDLRGANDKVNAAFIGMGKMGQRESRVRDAAGESRRFRPSATSYKPKSGEGGVDGEGRLPRRAAIRDFREILADKSVDIVCIATPDHWHPYMTVEACKAGKDVYVEKPICVTVEEGKKMVEAARKYKRVVQAGTQQRSGEHFQKAVRTGEDRRDRAK